MGKMNGSANLRGIAAGDLLVWSVSYGLQQVENWVVMQPWLCGRVSRPTWVQHVIPQNSASYFCTNPYLVTQPPRVKLATVQEEHLVPRMEGTARSTMQLSSKYRAQVLQGAWGSADVYKQF